MLQKLSSNKFRTIENQIDSEIKRIDQLLSSLIPRQPSHRNNSTFHHHHIRCLPPNTDNALIPHQTSDQDLQYTFTNLHKQEKEQQILLQNYQHLYDHRYVEKITLKQPITTKVETKSNWITKYLDQSDCTLGFQFNCKQYQISHVQKGIVKCQQNQQKPFQIDIDSLYSNCNEIEVKFGNHMQGYALSMLVQNVPQIYSFTIKQNTRLILRICNQTSNMNRIVVLKQRSSSIKQYELIWGNYFKNNLLQSIQLETGSYILVSLGTTQIKTIEILLQDINSLELGVAAEHPLKTKHLLDLLFEEYIVGTSRSLDQSVKREYTRNVYMDIGLIMQSYENIYPYQAKFQNQTSEHQDIKLLFPQLYSPSQLQNRYKPGEHITKFYSIEQKPAHLFVPKKYVLMGNKIMDNFQAHSVFK